MIDYFIPKSFNTYGYSRLICSFQELGYEVRDFIGNKQQSAQLDKPHLILRHDVDMSLDAALNIGLIEKDLSVSSTYFVLLRSEMYNLFTPSSKHIIESLMKLGHRIGLHFDASLYEDSYISLDEAAYKECSILEEWIGAPVNIISFHRPASKLLGLDKKLAGRNHTYQPHFFQHMGYYSDSRGAWYHGNPIESSTVKEKLAIQLLTHPIWWQDDSKETVQGALDKFCGDRANILRNELANNCQTYDANKTLI